MVLQSAGVETSVRLEGSRVLGKWECGLAHCKNLVLTRRQMYSFHTSGGQSHKIWAEIKVSAGLYSRGSRAQGDQFLAS